MRNMSKRMEYDYDSRYYSYKGPVLRFGKEVIHNYTAVTKAKSEKQAINKLKSQAKVKLGLTYNSKVEILPKFLKIYAP